jgi:antitoxin component of MazEF toxin-antitoxin module
MTTKANRWGSALGIRLTNPVLEIFPVDEKTLLNLDVQKDKIIITRSKVLSKITLEELFEGFDGEYEVSEELREWEQMKPAGREMI